MAETHESDNGIPSEIFLVSEDLPCNDFSQKAILFEGAVKSLCCWGAS